MSRCFYRVMAMVLGWGSVEVKGSFTDHEPQEGLVEKTFFCPDPIGYGPQDGPHVPFELVTGHGSLQDHMMSWVLRSYTIRKKRGTYPLYVKSVFRQDMSQGSAHINFHIRTFLDLDGGGSLTKPPLIHVSYMPGAPWILEERHMHSLRVENQGCTLHKSLRITSLPTFVQLTLGLNIYRICLEYDKKSMGYEVFFNSEEEA